MSYYCKYCDRLVPKLEMDKNEQGEIIWIGCEDCYQRRLKNNATIKKQI